MISGKCSKLLPAALAAVLIPTLAHSFTAQLPVAGYEFAGPLWLIHENVGSYETMYTVPAGHYAVVTDIYVALSSGATGAHTTYIAKTGLDKKVGPFPVNSSSAFSTGYTSGLVFLPGESIIASDSGGTGNVTVNLVGYLVCVAPCS